MCFRQLHNDYRHCTWPMFSQNCKILKFSIQSEQKLTSVEKHLSPNTLIGPGKLPGLSRNVPQVRKLDLQKSRSSFWNRSGPKRIRHRVNTRTGSFWRIRHRVNTWTGSFWYFGAILKATTCILRMLNW